MSSRCRICVKEMPTDRKGWEQVCPECRKKGFKELITPNKCRKEVQMLDSCQIARVAHEVNRAYCQSLGDNSQPVWEEAPDWQAKSAIEGVEFHRNNPAAGPEASHENWLAQKRTDGWVNGDVKSESLREHPCMKPFNELPKEQQAKDFLFRAVVHALI